MPEANNLLVGPITSLFFAFSVSDSLAETGFDRRYSLAQEAFKRCKGAWLKSAREDALKDLADSGTSMALMLNPLSETRLDVGRSDRNASSVHTYRLQEKITSAFHSALD